VLSNANNIGCIHFVVASLQVSLCSFVTNLYESFTQSNRRNRHSNVGIKKISCVLLVLSPCVLIQKYLRVASALASASSAWPQPGGSNLGLGVLALFNITVSHSQPGAYGELY